MPRSAPTAAARRRQALITAIALVVIAAVFGVTWLINRHDDSTASTTTAATSVTKSSAAKTSTTKTSRSAKRSSTAAVSTSRSTSTSSRVPARVRQTLALIDSGDWPEAANAPGTHGGDVFRNNEGKLPRTNPGGTRITYREWDVNPKKRGQSRDAERIITGSDGSAYYTADHYVSFVVIRNRR
ncbi:ribonuclease domain-containing protein [Gordonia sp. ABSL49_1]|uniref:ribonuclease domain-containing protein n=1 Tax=unclassified Gordonia (in: high G+C Gram-positive bacteria) TaxID=2657482 RepID=UPI001F112339|nr:ribonuclease domain-containing protein [Gordonia sp. ABSL49_1]MCH5641601.1 ribonuclease N [Gordonia sp. ABSL49_1]